MINAGRGYDESNPTHNIPGEAYTPTSKFRHHGAYQDGENIWNLYLNGIKPEKIEGSVLHIDHGKAPENGGGWNKSGYKNTPEWGFLNSPEMIINDNTIMLY
jgi:hypothetical protein